MLVYRKEDLDVIKESIAEELKNNPKFESVFDSKISYDLDQIKNGYKRTSRQGIDVFVSKDGKNIQIREPMEISGMAYGTTLPHTNLEGSEINLRDDGAMEVVNTFGELDEARSYYQSNPQTCVLRNANAVLHAYYTYSRYEPSGIETARGSYSKREWELTGVNYNEEDKFSQQLYSKGYHMPKEWDAYGLPEPPRYVNEHASILGVCRLPGHKGIAEIFTADLKPNMGYSASRVNIVKERAYIHTEHPDRIRIDQNQIFAETDEHMQFKPTELYSRNDEYTGKTCDEIQADIEAKYPEWVKDSLEFQNWNRPEITVAALKECFGIEEKRELNDER